MKKKKKDFGTPLKLPKQEKFCQLYASDKEFFGNGVQSYIEAYNPKRKGNWYATVRSEASRLLTNANILKRIDELLEIEINNSFIDKRLGFWVTQLAHPNASIDAIKEYNKLKKRVNGKLELEITTKSDAELDSELAGIVISLAESTPNQKRTGKKKGKSKV